MVGITLTTSKVTTLRANKNTLNRLASLVDNGDAEGDAVCLAAKLAADAGNLDTTRFSEPTVYLEKASVKALEQLSKNAPNGFFLMIESAIIDGYGHNNDSDGMIEEMKELTAC